MVLAFLGITKSYSQVSFGETSLFNDSWLFNKDDAAEMSSPNYDDSKWRRLELPHDWSIEGLTSPTLASCTGYLPAGVAWYRKHFDIADLSERAYRRWLLENGFAIVGETITHEDRQYQTIAARFSGKSEEYTEEELLLGRLNIQNNAPNLAGFIEHEIGVWEAIRRGKAQAANADTRDEDRTLQFLSERLEILK